uniref:Uncharacterized protein n=1 Tax=Aegilops tauschii subsp. strangulata TaxID=200361 RepID=A0A453C8T2_AEGTS
ATAAEKAPRQPQPKKLPLDTKQSTRLPLPRRNLHPLLPPAPAPHPKGSKNLRLHRRPSFLPPPRLPGARPASDPSPPGAVSESSRASPVPPPVGAVAIPFAAHFLV